VANGEYKMLLRALRVTGDANKEGEYDVYVSPVFKIDAPPAQAP
jgi:hypothetical protein